MPSRLIKLILLCCILVATAACYFPGLTSHFIFDDGVNIINNPHLRIEDLSLSSLWQAAISSNAGPLKRPISMVSFALDYYVAGMDAHHFKMTNLGIHLLNGVLVFILTRLLLKLYQRIQKPGKNTRNNFWIAIAVSTIWLLHPFNLTGVLYVVQRMTSLSALFTLAGLILYLYGRNCLLNGNRSGLIAIIASIFIATPLAALSKENGALLPFFILATEATLLRWHTSDLTTRRILMLLVGLSTAVPVLFGLFYIWSHPGAVSGGYLIRDFSLSERLMTEARVMWFYTHMILLPNMTMMGLHHDDIPISGGLLSPPSTLFSILGLLFLMGMAIALRKKHPIFAFGIAFFFIGHALESSILPLEIAFEYRNYLPMFGILLPLTYYTLNPAFHPSTIRLRQVSFIVIVMIFSGLTLSRAQEWGEPFKMRLLEVERHPFSLRAHTDVAAIYNYLPARSQEEAVDFYNKALLHYQRAADISPMNVAGWFGVIVVNSERGLATDPLVVKTLEQKLATIPFSPPNVNALIGLQKSVINGQSSINPEVVDGLFNAALSNPTLTGAYRSLVLMAFSEFQLKMEHQAKEQK